jgi:molecular chaperone GrpE
MGMEDHDIEDTKEGQGEEPQEGVETPAGETPASEGPKQDKLADLAGQLDRTVRERDEFLDLLRRTRAEFSNYRKRVEREHLEIAHRAVGEFTKQLLPVLDDLDRAFEAVEKEHDNAAFLTGMRIVEQKFGKALSDAGVTAVHTEQEPFDPLYHEAVMAEEHDKLEPGMVSGVVRKGYMMKGKPLRAAQVKVVKASSRSAKPAEPEEKKEDTGKEREE